MDPQERSPRCSVYRHYDSHEQLLYVGVSVTPISRQEQHRIGPFWPFRTDTLYEWHPTTDAAKRAEATAILSEVPIFNDRGRDREIRQRLVSAYLSEPSHRRIYLDYISRSMAMADEHRAWQIARQLPGRTRVAGSAQPLPAAAILG